MAVAASAQSYHCDHTWQWVCCLSESVAARELTPECSQFMPLQACSAGLPDAIICAGSASLA